MTLAKLDVTNLRNIETAQIEPAPRLNFIIGPNGSGKTSLLEAIHILGRARSFRSTQSAHVIRFQQEELTVTGGIQELPDVPALHIGVRLGRHKREMVLAGARLQSSADLIRAFPVLLIHPASSGLLEGAPKSRRQFLDWGTFHLNGRFLDHWRGYARALDQRNAMLRSGQSRGIEIWDRELSRHGTIVANLRAAYMERLQPVFRAAAREFLGSIEFEARPSAGWDTEKPLEEALKNEIWRDLKDGYTHLGPHKGDFSVLAEGRPARNYLSRGQMKLLVFALMLAQAQLQEESTGPKGCVLIDDLASELDRDSRERLLRFVQLRQGQFFVTATDRHLLGVNGWEQTVVFEAEHGRITQL